jgi:hypothetical protein
MEAFAAFGEKASGKKKKKKITQDSGTNEDSSVSSSKQGGSTWSDCASIAEQGSMPSLTMLPVDSGDSVRVDVDMNPSGNGDAKMRGDSSGPAMEGGIDIGERREERSIGNLSIDGSGRTNTGQSLPDTTSTTETRIEPTTASKTSNASPLRPTMRCTNVSAHATSCETGLSAGNVNGVSSTSPLPTSPSEEPELITDTASLVLAHTYANGAPHEVSANSPARFFATCPDDRGIDEGEAEAVRRFFYSGKATRRDRNEGLGDAPEKPLLWSAGTKNPGSFQAEGTNRASQNAHPTVKPVNGPNGTPGLMRYLCRLITPPNGIVLDPFSGSFSTGKAAMLEGFRFVGIEREEEYVAIGRARIEHAYATRRAEEMKGDERLPL